jgi:hypothetical protein
MSPDKRHGVAVLDQQPHAGARLGGRVERAGPALVHLHEVNRAAAAPPPPGQQPRRQRQLRRHRRRALHRGRGPSVARGVGRTQRRGGGAHRAGCPRRAQSYTMWNILARRRGAAIGAPVPARRRGPTHDDRGAAA